MKKSALNIGYGDYLRFSQLVQERCGLHFPLKKRADLEAGVRQAFAASTCTGLDEYYRLLLDPRDGAVEMDRLVNALTVSETHFFRNAGHFNALYNHVLPQIIERRRALRTMRIWSAGCASGAEPYSIAIMLRELVPDLDQWSITILGTDVNTAALDRARKAVYGEWAFREARAKQWRHRYFRATNATTGTRSKSKRYTLNDQVRRMVTFAYLNLAEDNYPSYETNTTLMDLILCRNVTIYFTESVTAAIVDRFYDALADNGWLIVGHSEHSLTTYRHFQARNFSSAILYQRTGQPTALPSDWDWLTAKQTPPPAPTKSPMSAPVLQKKALPLAKRQPEPETVEDPLERARQALDRGHSEQAREQLLPLVETQPDNVPLYTLLGQACANLGYWEEAESWCRQALRVDKLALEAYYTLALVLQHQGQLDQAIDAMKKVVYIDRKNVLGHFGLADLYRNNGQLPQAQKSLDNARCLLASRTDEALIPNSGGITVSRLRETIVRQQQQWSAQADSLPSKS